MHMQATPSISTPQPFRSALEARLASFLRRAWRRDAFVGVQVCVYARGVKVVDLAAGVMGTTDPRPVKRSSLFNVFSVTKAVTAVCAHVLADRGLLRVRCCVISPVPRFPPARPPVFTFRFVGVSRCLLGVCVATLCLDLIFFAHTFVCAFACILRARNCFGSTTTW
jgi:hypothetical protein